MKKIRKRSKSRLFIGKLYFLCKAQIYWYLSNQNFAKTKSQEKLPVEIFTHKTKLLRKLKDIDMWMQYNKVKNLEIATSKLNGLIIKPGQTFSYWRQIGSVTKNKGYVDGMILHDGEVKSGVGGGLCQLSNLIFWMVLHSPLIIVERWRHSYDVFPDVNRTQPFGSGATCAYPNIDLQIKNETNQSFQIVFEITDTYLVGKLLSDNDTGEVYKIVEKDHEIKGEMYGGYSRNNKIFREVFDQNGIKKREELVAKNHAIMMYNPILEENKNNW